MRNATLSVLWVLLLGASAAAAQTDDMDPGGDAAPDAPADEAPADPTIDPAVADPAVADPAVADPAADDAAASDAAASDAAASDAAASDDLSSPAGSTADESAAEASATEELAAPDAEASEEAEEEEAPAPPQLPWRNSFFSWTHQVTFNSFVRDAQLSYNPLYVQALSLAPRWYLAPTSYFMAIQSLQVELTDSDGDALNRDPQLGDTVIEFRQMFPWEGFMFMGQARVTLPVSKISQAAQVYLGTGLGLTVVRPIPEINLTLAGVFRWSHTFAGSNVARTGVPQPDSCPGGPMITSAGAGMAPEFATATCDQLGTASTGRDSILSGFFATLAFDALTINLQAFFFSVYGHELAPAYVNVATREEPLMIADGSPTHWRNFTYFAVSVGYQVTSWLNLSLGIQNSHIVASAWNPDGSIRNPLFTPDTQAFLSATVQLDTIYTEMAGSADDGLTPEERQRRRQGLASGPSTGVAF